MQFNSLEYALFLGAIVAGYRFLSHRLQNLLLLVASYAFYAAWDWRFLSLIWISTIVDYTSGRRIAIHHEQGSTSKARRWMLLSVATNLGLLGIFKYLGFFVDSAVTALTGLGVTVSDTTTLSIAMELTERELDQPSQISAVPLVRRNGTWADLELPDDHPAAPALRRLQAADRSLAYGSTTPLIQSVVGDGTYVANSILAEKDDVIVSSATWVDGGPSIIPEVDQILFFKDQETNWMVAWHDVVAHVGDLMQPTDFYPTRFRVESFPTADQLAAMPLVEDWRQ